MPTSTRDDLAEHPSILGFQATIERLTEVIAELGMRIFATIDHAREAEAVGLTMPPTVVLLYGNPRGGTSIMLDHPEAALDLPPRLLVRQPLTGGVLVSFHPIGALLAHAGVPIEASSKLELAQSRLVSAISG